MVLKSAKTGKNPELRRQLKLRMRGKGADESTCSIL